VSATTAPDPELAARFVVEAVPLVDALGRRARRLTNSEADAEDLVQDTLLHAFEGFGSYRQGTNLSAWLFRILHNRWVSRHRYRQSRPVEVALEALTATGHERSIIRRSAEAEVLNVIPDEDVAAALTKLSDGARTAVYYVGIEGYTYAEAAALMGVPMGTVMSRVSRGRQKLSSALSHRDDDRRPGGISPSAPTSAADAGNAVPHKHLRPPHPPDA
jgi:RNA polymerase sigma factor (sigma-70 family)